MEGSGPVPVQEIKVPGGPKFTDLSDPDLVHCFFSQWTVLRDCK
jgi:hypothetical protein